VSPEVFPEGAEVTGLLEWKEVVDEEIDLGLGHVALVGKFLETERLNR
jgi:hypothetical protein